jgi:hypothetical protein
MKTISPWTHAAAVLFSTLSLAGAALAQPTRGQTVPSITRPPVSATALPFDLAAVYQSGPAIIEQWTTTNPCTPHSHTYTGHVRATRRSGPFPNPTATLYKDGQPIETWDLSNQAVNTTVTLGKFTWTKEHPCPSGGTYLGQGPTPNYRFVVDPGNVVSEQSEHNNVVEFHVDPSVPFIRLQP